jgi:hypothetical protein
MKVSANPRIKYLRENKLTQKIFNANNEMFAIVFITLYRIFPKEFYSKTINELAEKQKEYAGAMDRYVDDGIYDYKSEQLGKSYGIDANICKAIVEKQICSKYKDERELYTANFRALCENLKFLLINLAAEFGIGKQRMSRLCDELLTVEITEPVKEVKERFGIDMYVEIEDIDFRKFMTKKEKAPSYSDCQRGRQGLQALKAYQDTILREV